MVATGNTTFSGDNENYLHISSQYSNEVFLDNFVVSTLIDPNPDVLLGDINLDGVVDLLDVAFFVDIVLGNSPAPPEADINNDGVVDLLDVAPFVALLLGN